MERSGVERALVGVETLVRRCQRGDPFALDQLVRELGPYVGRICGSIALDQGDDAAQETMTVVVCKIGELREPAALFGWVRRIAVREAIRVVRRTRDVPVDPADLTTVRVDDATEATEIRDALARLTPEQRAVLVLRHLYGIPEHEVAAMLDVPVGTLKSRAHRARQVFRQRWSA